MLITNTFLALASSAALAHCAHIEWTEATSGQGNPFRFGALVAEDTPAPADLKIEACAEAVDAAAPNGAKFISPILSLILRLKPTTTTSSTTTKALRFVKDEVRDTADNAIAARADPALAVEPTLPIDDDLKKAKKPPKKDPRPTKLSSSRPARSTPVADKPKDKGKDTIEARAEKVTRTLKVNWPAPKEKTFGDARNWKDTSKKYKLCMDITVTWDYTFYDATGDYYNLAMYKKGEHCVDDNSDKSGIVQITAKN
ncbi:hypothetical protein QBC35DRAFT_454650 [Podospora australis]|uniref:Cell wall protein n=1 Tax=Podospora australis TaxID=1536484 RepID=A0AAN7AGI7_9PEZI|nr:hypothetical protein QBC35DRAFT_454650 [Podospora australis]